MATNKNASPVGTAEVNKSELSLADILRAGDSLHVFRQGYGLFSHDKNRFHSSQQVDALLNNPLPDNNYAPTDPAAETLLLLINDFIYADVKTIRFFLPLVRRVYQISMPSDPNMIDTLIQKFQILSLVCKREQRAGKTDYVRPFQSVRVAAVCITANGARYVTSAFRHQGVDLRSLSLPQLDEASVYGLVASNFVQVAFARTYIPEGSLDPYFATIEFHFPKYKYVREFADELSGMTLTPGRIIFPSREIGENGQRTKKKVCIFTSQLTSYNIALIKADDFRRVRRNQIAVAKWSAGKSKESADDYEIVETAVFIAIEDMNAAVQLKEEMIELLESSEIDHVYLTSEAAVEEFCIKRRCVLGAALMELRQEPGGEYKYKSPDPEFFR